MDDCRVLARKQKDLTEPIDLSKSKFVKSRWNRMLSADKDSTKILLGWVRCVEKLFGQNVFLNDLEFRSYYAGSRHLATIVLAAKADH